MSFKSDHFVAEFSKENYENTKEYEKIIQPYSAVSPLREVLCLNDAFESNSVSRERCVKCERASQNNQKIESDLVETATKLKNVYIRKPKITKKQPTGLVVSLRYGKYSRRCKSRHSWNSNLGRIKKTIAKKRKKNNCLEKRTGTPKKGKRGKLGGKAKGKPPEEEIINKRDSDEESENLYFYRISLGFFQQNKDDSGASTSNQPENFSSTTKKEFDENNSEEMELLELQRWGMSSSFSTQKVPEKPLITDKIEKLDQNFAIQSEIQLRGLTKF